MRYLQSVYLFLLMVLSVETLAITNIESQRKREEVQGLQGEVELALSGKSGNSDKESTELGVRLDYRQQQHQILGILNHEREKNDGIENSDNSFAHLRYIQHRSDTFAWESFVQYQEDAFRSLDARSLVGAGARFNISPKSESYLLIVGAGAYYTEEVYNLEMGKLREDYLRGNSYISYTQPLGPNATLSNTLYWQPRFSQPSDSYVYNHLSLDVVVTKALLLRVTLETQYDSDPVEDVENTDHSYVTSLLYRF